MLPLGEVSDGDAGFSVLFFNFFWVYNYSKMKSKKQNSKQPNKKGTDEKRPIPKMFAVTWVTFIYFIQSGKNQIVFTFPITLKISWDLFLKS